MSSLHEEEGRRGSAPCGSNPESVNLVLRAGAAGAGQLEHGREERGGGDHTRAALRQASQSGPKLGSPLRN